MAINRIRSWYDENRERCRFGEDDLCRKILANVIGFDLNPLAVMAARTNYLIAIRDLIGHVERVEIPIYLCDSIMTPSEHGGLFTGALGKAKELKTAPTTFIIPTEIATNREDVGKYAEQLEFCVRNSYSPDEFIERCRDEGLPITSESLHKGLYRELVKLDKAKKNSVWARIIKNAFAPLFIEPADYVVGNPPWVNWESLPADYRESTLVLWDKYRLRERATHGARLGNVKKELSSLFVYVSMDHYVAAEGKLGFVITQSIFKSGANEGFRRLALNVKQPFRAYSVSDLSLLLPFEHAINRTAIFIAQKGRPTKYPIPYKLWVPNTPRFSVPEADLDSVLNGVEIRDWLAKPVEPSVYGSTWLTAARDALPVLQKVIGDRSLAIMDRTYARSCTWLNGVFWVEPVKPSDQRLLIRNLGDVGRSRVDVVTAPVEKNFLFPLLRGRDVRAWRTKPSLLILVPHYKDDFSQPVNISELKRESSLTFDFLKRFEQPLRARSGYRQLHRERPEFYVVGNVGNYTLAPYKVIFKDLTEFFQCAVVEPSSIHGLTSRPVIPDHTLLFTVCQTREEAHFLAGVLNSIPARVALYSASVGVQTQRYFPTDVSRIHLPAFDPDDDAHREVVRLSAVFHKQAATEDDFVPTNSAELELARAAARIWKISEKELRNLVKFHSEIRAFRHRRLAAETAGRDGGNG